MVNKSVVPVILSQFRQYAAFLYTENYFPISTSFSLLPPFAKAKNTNVAGSATSNAVGIPLLNQIPSYVSSKVTMKKGGRNLYFNLRLI